jgi:hypothetical protein
MDNISGVAFGAFLVHSLLVLGLSVRVIMRRRPVGILLAWMALILSVPVLGMLAYLVLGESQREVPEARPVNPDAIRGLEKGAVRAVRR